MEFNWSEFGLAGLVIASLFVLIRALVVAIINQSKEKEERFTIIGLKTCIDNNTTVMESISQIVRALEISNTRIEEKQGEILERCRNCN